MKGSDPRSGSEKGGPGGNPGGGRVDRCHSQAAAARSAAAVAVAVRSQDMVVGSAVAAVAC